METNVSLVCHLVVRIMTRTTERNSENIQWFIVAVKEPKTQTFTNKHYKLLQNVSSKSYRCAPVQQLGLYRSEVLTKNVHVLYQWCLYSWVLDFLSDIISPVSMVTSPFLFLKPFIFLVCSLLRSCFCMCRRPYLVPKASWETFFFFLGCKKTNVFSERNTNGVHVNTRWTLDE